MRLLSSEMDMKSTSIEVKVFPLEDAELVEPFVLWHC